jgi:hypothetical protein
VPRAVGLGSGTTWSARGALAAGTVSTLHRWFSPSVLRDGAWRILSRALSAMARGLSGSFDFRASNARGERWFVAQRRDSAEKRALPEEGGGWRASAPPPSNRAAPGPSMPREGGGAFADGRDVRSGQREARA